MTPNLPPPPDQAHKVWVQVETGMRWQFGRKFDTLFRGVKLQSAAKGVFTLTAPHDRVRDWLAHRLSKRLTADFQRIAKLFEVDFERLEFVTVPPAPLVKSPPRPPRKPVIAVSPQLALPATVEPAEAPAPGGLEVQVAGTTSAALMARIKWATVLELWREQQPDLLPRLKGAPLSVWLALTVYANQAGLCRPSIDTLARDTGYSRPVVIKAVTTLAKEGLLSKTYRQHTSTQYCLLEPAPSKESLLQEAAAVEKSAKGESAAPPEKPEVKKIDHQTARSKESLPELSSTYTKLPEKDKTTTSLVRVKKVDFLEWEPVRKELADEGFTKNEIARMIAGALKHDTTIEAALEWIRAYQTTLKGKVTKGYLHNAFVHGWKIRPEQKPPDLREGKSYLEPEYAHIVEH